MLVPPERLTAALRLPEDAVIDWEPLAGDEGPLERVILRGPDGELEVLLRSGLETEAAFNNIAVLEALGGVGYPHAPRLLAVLGEVAVEQSAQGASALSLLPPDGSLESAIDALAALHALPVSEGLDWGAAPADILPPGEIPLHRLGFAAHEREPAASPLAAAHAEVLAGPFGFAHRHATASNILLRPGGATLTAFGRAGYGSHLFDVAAFLLTAGLEPEVRLTLAGRYGRLTGRDELEAAAAIDLAGILWGIQELLELPRRLVLNLGDDAASDRIHLAVNRIERGIRTPAGRHPLAAAIRAALWPQ